MDTDHSNYFNKIIKKEYVNLAYITEEIDNYKSFRENLIKFGENILNNDIWELFITLNITELISKNSYFKEQNNFLQCINLLQNKELFCFKFISIEGCTFIKK